MPNKDSIQRAVRPALAASELEADFFRRGDELADTQIGPVDDFGDLDADLASASRARWNIRVDAVTRWRPRPPGSWSRRERHLAGGAAVAVVFGLGLVVGGATTRPVDRPVAIAPLRTIASDEPAPVNAIAVARETDRVSPPASLSPPDREPPPDAPSIRRDTRDERPAAHVRARKAGSSSRPARARPAAPEAEVPRARMIATPSATGPIATPRRLAAPISPPGLTPPTPRPSKSALRQRAFGHHYRRRGMRRQAAQAFRDYLRLDPRARDATEVRRLISQLDS